jgi:DNA polymerase IV
VRDRAEAGAVLTRLCEQVAGDLQRKGYTGRTIGIKITFDNFEKVTRDITIPEATADAAVIRRHAGLCLKRVDLSRRFRLLGVRVGKLVKPGTEGAAAASYSGSPAPQRTHRADDDRTDLLFPELD